MTDSIPTTVALRSWEADLDRSLSVAHLALREAEREPKDQAAWMAALKRIGDLQLELIALESAKARVAMIAPGVRTDRQIIIIRKDV